ncbi:MAG TPA: response regulator [Terriglobales bacterium]|nr:response regulator [Terriglobales bacterium]
MARVLVVEDHADSRDMLAYMLASAGHVPVTAADVVEALARLREGAVDVAVVDIYLPGVDGITLMGMIRDEWPRTRIIAVSSGLDANRGVRGRANLSVLARARAAGAEGALPKPLVKEALLALVAGLVEDCPVERRRAAQG